MCLWGRRFFGLMSVSKEDLFLREIQYIMRAYPGTSYWDAYYLPVPFRKWLINEYNRQQSEMEQINKPKINNKIDLPPRPVSPSLAQPMQSVKK